MRYAPTLLLPLLASAAPSLKVGTIHSDAAPILSTTEAEVVPDQYMVVFKKHVDPANAKKHHQWVQSVHSQRETDRMELRKRSQVPVTTDIFDGLKHTYNIVGGMMGYSGHFDDDTMEQIRRSPDVSTLSLLWFRHCAILALSRSVQTDACLSLESAARSAAAGTRSG